MRAQCRSISVNNVAVDANVLFLVTDGRNLWHDQDFSATPITYMGIGRSSQHSPVELAELAEVAGLKKLVSQPIGARQRLLSLTERHRS